MDFAMVNAAERCEILVLFKPKTAIRSMMHFYINMLANLTLMRM